MSYIYIGPDVPAEGLRSGKIFLIEPAELIRRLESRNPLADMLFVDEYQFPRARRDLKEPGSMRTAAYKQMR